MSPKATEIQIRDQRRQGWFSIDNEVIDLYAEELGHHGIALYCVLARHVNNTTQQARLGLSALAKKLKMGRTKLVETLALLEDIGLLDIQHGDYETPNVYTLLEVPKGTPSPNEDYPSPNEDYPSPNEDSIKTIFENSSLKQEEATELVVVLTALSRWPYEHSRTLEVIAKNAKQYPRADAQQVVRDFEYAYLYGTKKPMVDLPATLRTYWRKQHEWSNGSGNLGERKHREKEYVN